MNNFTLVIAISPSNYFKFLLFFTAVALIAALIIGSSYLLARQNPESEKLSPYECGFEPYENARNTFGINFSLIAILFILFDIEIMFLMPWCILLSESNLLDYWVMMDFLLELSIGYFYAWHSKALNFE